MKAAVIRLSNEELCRLHQQMLNDKGRAQLFQRLQDVIFHAPVCRDENGNQVNSPKVQVNINYWTKAIEDYQKQNWPQLFQQTQTV